jgi:hypothetical protein
MSTPLNRAEILGEIRAHLQGRIQSLSEDLKALQQTNADNQKSSVGDKHDTEREMVAQEMDTLIGRIEQERQFITLIDSFMVRQTSPTQAQSGAIIQTDRATFLLGIPIGKVLLASGPVMGISLQSPIGQNLLGKTAGVLLSVGAQQYHISAIY